MTDIPADAVELRVFVESDTDAGFTAILEESVGGDGWVETVRWVFDPPAGADRFGAVRGTAEHPLCRGPLHRARVRSDVAGVVLSLDVI